MNIRWEITSIDHLNEIDESQGLIKLMQSLTNLLWSMIRIASSHWTRSFSFAHSTNSNLCPKKFSVDFKDVLTCCLLCIVNDITNGTAMCDLKAP